MSWRLNRTKQCPTCPWIEGNSVENIPNYNPDKHGALIDTIAEQGALNFCENRIMACHYSVDGNDEHCIGWLVNQIGAGNNIGMRIQMMQCENSKEIETIGEQRETFEETFE